MRWLLMVCGVLWAQQARQDPELLTGIPTAGVEGFREPMYQTVETGWSAQVEDGLVRVYVAPEVPLAEDWIVRFKEYLFKFDLQPYTAAVSPETPPQTPPPHNTPLSLIQRLQQLRFWWMKHTGTER